MKRRSKAGRVVASLQKAQAITFPDADAAVTDGFHGDAKTATVGVCIEQYGGAMPAEPWLYWFSSVEQMLAGLCIAFPIAHGSDPGEDAWDDENDVELSDDEIKRRDEVPVEERIHLAAPRRLARLCAVWNDPKASDDDVMSVLGTWLSWARVCWFGTAAEAAEAAESNSSLSEAYEGIWD